MSPVIYPYGDIQLIKCGIRYPSPEQGPWFSGTDARVSRHAVIGIPNRNRNHVRNRIRNRTRDRFRKPFGKGESITRVQVGWIVRRDGRRSTNVEDRRGAGVRTGAVGGGIGIIVILGLALLLGADPSAVLSSVLEEGGSYYGDTGTGTYTQSAEEADLADFVSVVLADTEDTWDVIFTGNGMEYVRPKLVLFSGSVDSGCGFARAATGPFYCPADGKVYIDLAFYRELRDQFGAPGDFAQAYVIAHEVGHHVQNLDGKMDQVRRLQEQVGEAKANRLSVLLELQADCYAGVWANRADEARRVIEPGDIEEALNAASRIGDDTLQKESQGYVVPDSFTHGTSAQRTEWFTKGYTSGDAESCSICTSDRSCLAAVS